MPSTLFDHIKDLGVRYAAGKRWKPDPGPNKTGVDPKPTFHDYLWLCNEGIALGECTFLAAAFVLAAGALGHGTAMEVGLCFPWPRRVNSTTPGKPDTPDPGSDPWPNSNKFQGRYQRFAVQGGHTRKYVRTHTIATHAKVEKPRFLDGNGFGNTFEAVARSGPRMYAIGEKIVDASSHPAFSSQTDEEKIDMSASLFYAKNGDLNRGAFKLYFLKVAEGEDNTSKDSDSKKCEEPYDLFSDPHFRFEH